MHIMLAKTVASDHITCHKDVIVICHKLLARDLSMFSTRLRAYTPLQIAKLSLGIKMIHRARHFLIMWLLLFTWILFAISIRSAFFGSPHNKTAPSNDFAPMQGSSEILNVRYATVGRL
jgi:hypothetical protein